MQARGREFKSHHLHKIKEFGVAVVTLEFGSKGGGSIPSSPGSKSTRNALFAVFPVLFLDAKILCVTISVFYHIIKIEI